MLEEDLQKEEAALRKGLHLPPTGTAPMISSSVTCWPRGLAAVLLPPFQYEARWKTLYYSQKYCQFHNDVRCGGAADGRM
jgi:hypothetical protein